MRILLKEFTILSRGRKLFDCVMGKYPAKLLINDVSKDLQVGGAVLLHVDDRSTRSSHGTSLRFEPLGVVDPDRIEEYESHGRDRMNAERWLRFAEDDAERGLTYSNAIQGIRWTCRKHEHLLERVGMLEERIKANRLARENGDQDAKDREKLEELRRELLREEPGNPHLSERVRRIFAESRRVRLTEHVRRLEERIEANRLANEAMTRRLEEAGRDQRRHDYLIDDRQV